MIIYATSDAGVHPKYLLYSLLNWETELYPTFRLVSFTLKKTY